MSCCGHKRAQLFRRETAHVIGETTAATPSAPAARPPSVFIYTGNSELTLRGAASGAIYRFDHPGATLEISYEDSFAMRAERDVRLWLPEARRAQVP